MLILLKALLTVAECISIVIALMSTAIAAVFIYNLAMREYWEYPWWVLLVLFGITGAAWVFWRQISELQQQLEADEW